MSLVHFDTFATGGVVSKGLHDPLNARIHMDHKISWGYSKHRAPKPCGKRRGGPRSETYCEVYRRIPHTEHIGRSQSGKWFFWKEEE